MNKTLYIILMLLIVIVFIVGAYVSLEAGETWLKTIGRSTPIFFIMFIFYYLRKIGINDEKLKKEKQKNITHLSDKNE
ncbi:MAG: hypothetical protein OQK75_12820 [Gammaproteobacteria bacterium]|nr:hypothetical protein [Gammaproteobacteria bacterium]MCW8988541.1 hypothetical protein [Gammaproteobacteria bacterium]